MKQYDILPKDILVRLIAQENISIKRTNTHTASFDVKTRILTLPNYVFDDENVHDLMLFHEVAHALYTPQNLEIEQFEKYNSIIHDIVNVLEDIRIEKLIKVKFPVCHNIFKLGYEKLVSDNFFGNISNERYSIIDQINIYAKCLSDETKKLLNQTANDYYERALKNNTFKDVLKLSEEIYLKHYDKHHSNKKLEDIDISISTDTTENEKRKVTVDEDYSSTDLTLEDDTAESENLEINTVRSFNHNLLSKLSDVPEHQISFSVDSVIGSEIVSWKQINTDYTKITNNNFTSNVMEPAKYLSRMFQQHKSANVFRYKKQYTSGRLDLKKLHASNYSDNIFKSITQSPEGKNHGVLMLLDMSGSMYNNITKCMIQISQIAVFLKMNNIPFHVYGFTSKMLSEGRIFENFQLKFSDNVIQLLSSDMTMNQLVTYTKTYIKSIKEMFKLGYTPLLNTLLIVRPIIKHFKKKYNVDKMNMILFTDGNDDCDLFGNYFRNNTNVNWSNESIRITDSNYGFIYDLQYSKTSAMNLVNNVLNLIKQDDVMVSWFYINNDIRYLNQMKNKIVGVDVKFEVPSKMFGFIKQKTDFEDYHNTLIKNNDLLKKFIDFVA